MITDEALSAYLDGEADLRQQQAIEAELLASPPLRERLRALRARDQAVRAAFGALLEQPVPANLNVAARARPPANIIPFPTRRAPPRVRAWVGAAIAAQAAVLVGAAVLLQPVRSQPAGPSDTYTALSAPAAPDTRPNLVLMFRPDTRESDVRRVLSAIDARVVGGPTAAGAWLVHAPKGRLDAALRALRSEAAVQLAEPVDVR